VNIFFSSVEIPIFSRTLPSLAKWSFKSFSWHFYPRKVFLKQLPYWLVVRFQGVVVQLFLSKVGPLFKEPVVFGRPPTSSFDVNTFKSCLTCVECSFFKFWVFSQLENLLRRRGKDDGIYALPHNLSKKFLYGMKPSSSSLSASSSRSLIVSSLGISSPKLVKKFSSSANIMVPFSFLS